MGLWGRKEVDRDVPARSDQGTGARESFDELAIGLAGGTMPRRRALRLFGGALVGAAVASIPRVTSAKPCKPLLHKCITNIDCCSRNCITTNRRGNGKICGCPTGQTLVDRQCVAAGCTPGTTAGCGFCVNSLGLNQECTCGNRADGSGTFCYAPPGPCVSSCAECSSYPGTVCIGQPLGPGCDFACHLPCPENGGPCPTL
jgi:hypothetical protein